MTLRTLLWLDILEAAVRSVPVYQKPRPQETKGPASTLLACLLACKPDGACKEADSLLVSMLGN